MFGETETVNKYPMPVHQPRKKVVSERDEEDMYPFTKLGFNLVLRLGNFRVVEFAASKDCCCFNAIHVVYVQFGIIVRQPGVKR